MAIRFLCPFGHRLVAPDHRAGKKGRCPTCQQRVIVPVPTPRPSGRQKRPANSARVDPMHVANSSALAVGLRNAPAAAPAFPAAGQQEPRVDQPPALPPSAGAFLAPPQAAAPFAPSPARVLVPPPVPPARPAAVVPAERVPKATVVRGLPTTPSRRASEAARPASASRPMAYRWFGRFEPDLAREAYQPDPDKIQMVYWLAGALAFVAVFSAAPALGHLNLSRAPGWARVVLLAVAIELVYTAWLASVPDFTTVWVGMLVLAAVAAVYGMGMAIVAATPAGKPPILGLAEVRSSAAGWCGANVLLAGLVSYVCGRISTKWRRTCELAQLRQGTARPALAPGR